MFRLARTRGAAILGVVAVLIAACTTSRTGPLPPDQTGARSRPACDRLPPPIGICTPSATTGTGSLTSIPTYTEGPADGSGWSTQPLDQPRPLPGEYFDGWYTDFDLGTCQWLTPELLEAFEWTGEEMTTGPIFCVIPIVDDQVLQLVQPGPYPSFAGPSVDEVAFMRSIEIAGLEAREFDLVPSQEAHPGSCQVEVNTRSLSHLNVLAGTADFTSEGTDPAPMCERARHVATLIAQTFVPLAGGTPWPPTPQQPTPEALAEHGACELVGSAVVFGSIEGVEGKTGTDGPATTCTWQVGDIRAVGWLHDDLPAAWQAELPLLAEKELTADTTLGVMPTRLQLTPDGAMCGEAVQYTTGQVLRITYQNPQFKPEELCRIAEEIVGHVIAKLADSQAS